MTKNVGTLDRVMRAIAAIGAGTCAMIAPLPLALRLAVFGAIGSYMLWTAVAGTCLGYRLLGRSTCKVATK